VTRRLWSAPARGADLLIKGARVVDPLAGLDESLDVLLRKGRIQQVGTGLEAPAGCRAIVADGWVLLPGFVDLHAHTRTPGREDEEDLASATRAAAAGGYVTLFSMANTDPVVDTAPLVEALALRALSEAVVPIGFFAAVTRGQRGEELTEMWELARAGAVGFSDDGRPLGSAHLTRRALQYAKITDRFVAVHAEDESLTRGGVMHEGAVSAKLGLGGMPSVAESIEVERALELAAYEKGRLHLCHLSTAASLEHLERAKKVGVRVTAEVTPHHLTLTDECVRSLDPNYKMNPPLRPEADRKALAQALRSGLIDCVATDHAPHAQQEKEVPFEDAPFGTLGLETAFAAVHQALVASGALKLPALVERMSQSPARIAGIAVPTVQAGEEANICLVDLRQTWTVTPAELHSRAKNSAWSGAKMKARVKLTVAAGSVAWEDGAR
jgi:dihydroorotase